jgi:deoxyadenosine/deoxycytidine kinase
MALEMDIEKEHEKLMIVQNILKDKNKKFIVVDGLISAGKTTLINLFEKRMNSKNAVKVKAIFEPVDIWTSTGALQYFYDDIPAHCYEFQTYTYITRIRRIIDELYNNPDADIYIMERSIWTDRYIFMELLKNLIGELRFTMYNQWCDLWALILPLRVDKWVFLDTSLEESIRRIRTRNRNAENRVDENYQRQLYEKHIEFYNKLENDLKPVIRIQHQLMDNDFINNTVILDEIIQKIMNP